MTPALGPGPSTRVRRMAARASYDESFVFAVLDQALFVTLGVSVEGRCELIPTLAVRDGDVLYLHGSRSNAALTAAVRDDRATLSAVCYDGLRLARSGFESSIAYRSVTVVGRCRAVTGVERARALAMFTDRLPPGRGAEVRAPTERELRQTRVVALSIDEAAGKWSAGPTDDDAVDAGRAIWSGVVPARVVYGEPIGSFDGAMARGVAPSPAVARLVHPKPDRRTVALRDALAQHQPVGVRERRSVAALVDRLNWAIDPFDEFVDPLHVTASAFVVSSRGVILHRHRLLEIWVQPGGHVDGDEAPLAAAVRECAEETGLVARPLDGVLFHVDVHQGPRGHTHYDLRYVLVSDPADPRPPAHESPDVHWFSFRAAVQRAEPSLVPVLRRLARVVAAVDVGH